VASHTVPAAAVDRFRSRHRSAIGWFVGDGEIARFYSAVQRRTRLAHSGQFSRTRVCRLLDQSGQKSILAGNELSTH
jgi:hypothetical protein